MGVYRFCQACSGRMSPEGDRWRCGTCGRTSLVIPPHCRSCGNPLEHPADIEEGYHFLCVIPTKIEDKCLECGEEVEVEAANPLYCVHCVSTVEEEHEWQEEMWDEGGEAGC